MKRLNPDTRQPFRRNETRADGYIFVRYIESRPLRKDGTFVEEWKNPQRKKYGKKRLNEKTDFPFQKGDVDESTGLIFLRYEPKSMDLNGFCYETWTTPEAFNKAKRIANLSSKRKKKKTRELVQKGLLKRRINPETGQEFKEGDRDSFGRIFFTYVGQEKTRDGYVGEYWGSDAQWLRRNISQSLSSAKSRAKERGINFDVDLNYLESIFPSNYVCPVFHFAMTWGGDKMTSPSIDRIVPELGYVKGNVAWISSRANTRKLTRTPDVLRAIADWVENELAVSED